jgi:hypothetical protein
MVIQSDALAASLRVQSQQLTESANLLISTQLEKNTLEDKARDQLVLYSECVEDNKRLREENDNLVGCSMLIQFSERNSRGKVGCAAAI